MTKKVTLVVLDSVGVGELPDAKEYGDVGSNTLANISKKVEKFQLPNMEKLGLGNIIDIHNVKPVENALGCYGKAMEKSKGKDTVTGHWEIGGIVLEKPLKTYPDGFPKNIIEEFESKIGRKVLGNKVASGTVIIDELGEEHQKTGYPIVYTSADSVFQIAAHEEVIPLDKLYEMCQIARDMLVGDKMVGRVIARPFLGSEKGDFKRTSNRRDYAIDPFEKTMLEYIKEDNKAVMAVGKIEDIFNKKGITDAVHTKDNMDGVEKTLEYMKTNKEGLIFTNLVDFDMKFGHRNNVEGYAEALMEFDKKLPEIIKAMGDEDILILTADHGCDPTTPGTDHTREYTPILVYGKNLKNNVNLGIRKSFCDIGKTVLDLLNVSNELNGESFLKEIIK